MIKVESISKTFQSKNGAVQAVKDVSFEVKPGEIYGLIGMSGAGKSTVIRCLNLLEKPDSGKIFFDGEDLTTLPEELLRARRKQIGMIFQHFNLFEQKSVYENVAFPLRRLRLTEEKIRTRTEELLSYVELTSKKNAYPSELSGGQKQRVAIARALSTKPKLILSDEGTSALDPETTESILGLLRNSVEDFQVSIVMITHQMEVAKAICDRIGIMENGQIIEEGNIEEVFLRPKDMRTMKFLQKMPDPVSKHPEDLLKKTKYRLSFDASSVSTPLISRISRSFDIDVNILSGNINALTTGQVGHLIVEFQGEEIERKKAINFLLREGVFVEVIEWTT